LCNSLCPPAAARYRPDRVRLKTALLPDHAREKLQRQVIRPGRGFDQQAKRLVGTVIPGRLVG